MKIKKRICAALLLIGILAQTSCGFIVFNDGDETEAAPSTDTEDTTADTTTIGTSTPEGTAEPPTPGELARERLEALPDRDFKQAPVLIATVDNATICPTDTEDITIASRADSRRAVEEKFNTVIIANHTDAATMLNDAKQAYLSDMYYAELMAIPQSMVGSFRASGILANMNSLPHTNYTAEYYHQNIIDAAYAGDRLYAVSGAANFNPEYLSCIYFNRTLASECALGDLYTLVRDGKWTWDKLRELSIAADSNLDNVTGLGSVAPNADFIDLAAASHGIAYTSSSRRAIPTVNFLDNDSAAERARSAVDTLYNIIYKDNAFMSQNGDDVRNSFLQNSLLFSIDSLSFISQISDSDTEWGILPLPKYDESQSEYLSLLSPEAPVFCALENTSSYENSGLVLEGLNVASHGYVLDTYINDRIDYYLRDSGSIGMLKIICSGVTTDFSHMYASQFTNLANATYKAVQNAVTTRSSLDTIYKSYKTAADRELSRDINVSE